MPSKIKKRMKIQFNTDKNSSGSEKFIAPYLTQIEQELSRFSDRITRIEVHLSDEDGNKEGNDTKRCLMETRLKGRHQIGIINYADTNDMALSGALEKLTSSLDKAMDKLSMY
jgi:hypothetical protein